MDPMGEFKTHISHISNNANSNSANPLYVQWMHFSRRSSAIGRLSVLWGPPGAVHGLSGYSRGTQGEKPDIRSFDASRKDDLTSLALRPMAFSFPQFFLGVLVGFIYHQPTTNKGIWGRILSIYTL